MSYADGSNPTSSMFPHDIDLAPLVEPDRPFWKAWTDLMHQECHAHAVWRSPFAMALSQADVNPRRAFDVATVWAVNMVAGSYCFPRYVAALAARAESDAIRHALLENAWDESGGVGHTSRSHFWLAVRLARLLGATDAELAVLSPLESASHYTDEHFRMCASGEFAEALGMICLIEEFTTPEFSMILRALVKTWPHITGRAPDEFLLGGGAEYFTANIADDERHRQEMPRIVATWLSKQGIESSASGVFAAGLNPIRRGIDRSIALRSAFFDGIVEYVDAGGTVDTLLSRTTLATAAEN